LSDRNKGGRPSTLKIDRDNFEKLCEMQCTLNEIANFFDCTPESINKWCKKTYHRTFERVYDAKRTSGLASLRRNQFRLSETNAPMAIFLGKQYLGQRDVFTNNINVQEDDPLSKSIKELLNKAK
jgi:hypothetical protein